MCVVSSALSWRSPALGSSRTEGRRWDEAPQPSRVAEYAAFYTLAEDHQRDAHPTRVPVPKMLLRPGRSAPGTTVDLRSLHAGVTYAVVIRARTADGGGFPRPSWACRRPDLA